jgi:hypothetical protein
MVGIHKEIGKERFEGTAGTKKNDLTQNELLYIGERDSLQTTLASTQLQHLNL